MILFSVFRAKVESTQSFFKKTVEEIRERVLKIIFPLSELATDLKTLEDQVSQGGGGQSGQSGQGIGPKEKQVLPLVLECLEFSRKKASLPYLLYRISSVDLSKNLNFLIDCFFWFDVEWGNVRKIRETIYSILKENKKKDRASFVKRVENYVSTVQYVKRKRLLSLSSIFHDIFKISRAAGIKDSEKEPVIQGGLFKNLLRSIIFITLISSIYFLEYDKTREFLNKILTAVTLFSMEPTKRVLDYAKTMERVKKENSYVEAFAFIENLIEFCEDNHRDHSMLFSEQGYNTILTAIDILDRNKEFVTMFLLIQELNEFGFDIEYLKLLGSRWKRGVNDFQKLITIIKRR